MGLGERVRWVSVAVGVVVGMGATSGCGAAAPAPDPMATVVATSSMAPDSPAGVAVAWAKAVFAGARGAEQARTCPGSSGGNAGMMKLITPDVTDVSAGPTSGGGDSYEVTLELAGIGAVQEFSVHVARIGGTYYVC